MTDVYEFSEFERNNLVYNFITLTPQEVEEKKSNYAKLEAEKAAQKVEAAKKAAEQKAAQPKPKTDSVPAAKDNPENNESSGTEKKED